jgi:hypothetical protein
MSSDAFEFPWFEVYRVALLELDPGKISERLTFARQTLKERMQMAGLVDDEWLAITDALNNLYSVEVNERSRSQSRAEKILNSKTHSAASEL